MIGQQAPFPIRVGELSGGQQPRGGVMGGWPAGPAPDQGEGNMGWSQVGGVLQVLVQPAPPLIGVRGKVIRDGPARVGAAGLSWWGGLMGTGGREGHS